MTVRVREVTGSVWFRDPPKVHSHIEIYDSVYVHMHICMVGCVRVLLTRRGLGEGEGEGVCVGQVVTGPSDGISRLH